MLGMGISTPVAAASVFAGEAGCDCAAAGSGLPAIKAMMARTTVTLNVGLFFKNASTGSRSAKNQRREGAHHSIWDGMGLCSFLWLARRKRCANQASTVLS